MSFQPTITLQGIEQAVLGLGYRNEGALKYRLIAFIKGVYGKDGQFIEPACGIDPEELIRILWEVDEDQDSLRSKRKNLSSIKSSINADFKRLYREGKNPEGIMIGPENLFTISDEAKDDLLAKIRSGANTSAEIQKIAEMLNAMISGGQIEEELKGEIGPDIRQVRTLLEKISEKLKISEETGNADSFIREEASGGPDEGRTKGFFESLPEPEGEFPETDSIDLAEVEDDLFWSEENIDAENLTELSEGDLYEPLEEIDQEEEETLEVLDEEPFDEETEFFGPEIPAGEEETAGDGEAVGTADDAEGGSEETGEPFLLQEELPQAGEDSAAEEDEVVEEAMSTVFEEEPSPDPDEPPVESEEAPVGELEEIPEEEVDGLTSSDEGIGFEEQPDEYDEVVLAEAGEESQPEGEESTGPEEEEPAESAPVQEVSVGDEAGGTEEAAQEEDPRVLSEKFNNSLSEMDRLYNQYLLISKGEYTIGSANPKERFNRARRVRLADFYIGKFPVTNALFDVFVEKTGYRTTAERVGYGTVYCGRLQRKTDERTGREIVIWNSTATGKVVQGAFWYQPSGPGSNLHHKRNHPVVQVSIEDAMAFAAWTGKRLPTEEEWEAATRTVKGALYPWGGKFLLEACNVEKSGYGDTTPVDRYLGFQNEYGIADAMGNVMEWTASKFGLTGEIGRGGISFIAKGGSWTTATVVSLTGRTNFAPEFHSNNLGFRCVAT
ncbi:MAG: hypothetical protein C4576_15645 [Desulfobacteraceae bacterium]|nr:MAG: hypothetical protein C4576_15645 [Desulfobacteraceae bacterium]